MGKNVTRLFEQSRQENYDGMIASNALWILLETHGKALIAALENLVALSEDEDYPHASVVQAKQLLAQLEAEAQL